MHSWVIRSDIDGDGYIVKNISTKGIGFERPSGIDQIAITLTLY